MKVPVELHCRCDPHGREPCLGGCGYLCQRLAKDWLAAEAEYLAQRPGDGSIPAKQLWHQDTIEKRAYQKFKDREAAQGRET